MANANPVLYETFLSTSPNGFQCFGFANIAQVSFTYVLGSVDPAFSSSAEVADSKTFLFL